MALRARLTPKRPSLVIWVQDIYTLGLQETGEGGGFSAAVMRAVEGRTLRAADRVVVIHERFATYVEEHFGVPQASVEVIRNWTHLPELPNIGPLAAKKALGWPTDVTVAVHTGNMGLKQGLENVVDAARLAHGSSAPVLFVLIGNGSERKALQARARGFHSIRFTGPLDDHDYGLALAAADVLIVNEKPGVSAMAVPSKLTSYFHAGRPVIAAADPDGITASEIAMSGAGVVVPPGQPEALLDTVIALGADPEKRVRLGANGKRFRESELDQRVAIERWASLVRSMEG